MSSKVKVMLNRDAVRELLRSDPVESMCKELADGIASRAGGGYAVDTRKGKNRANATVSAASAAAARDNLKNNTLLKAMGK
ncbi:MAG: hypothetical protein VB055_06160 [Oscillospiraceae bacterium]|nr:hypothetical protein [Oscillospiraceae bacterium]